MFYVQTIAALPPTQATRVRHTGSLDSCLNWTSTPATIVQSDYSKCINA